MSVTEDNILLGIIGVRLMVEESLLGSTSPDSIVKLDNWQNSHSVVSYLPQFPHQLSHLALLNSHNISTEGGDKRLQKISGAVCFREIKGSDM